MHTLLLSDAQLRSELARCEFCEDKPCRDGCPCHCCPADFIMAARGGAPADIRRSAALIMTQNPLGGVCGAVCPDTFCQKACSHRLFDRAVEIPAVQAALVARAKTLDVMPILERPAGNGKRVAVIGGGPAGIGAALALAQDGFVVAVFEKGSAPGGAAGLIPGHRLPKDVLRTDIEWAVSQGGIELQCNSAPQDPAALLSQGFDGVIVTEGLSAPIRLGIPGDELIVSGLDFLAEPERFPVKGRVAVIGGGAVACDVATAAREHGASAVELFALETLAEMPLTPRERQELIDFGIEVNGRVRVTAVRRPRGHSLVVDTNKVTLPAKEIFHPARVVDVRGAKQRRGGFSAVFIAIGARSVLPRVGDPRVVYAGECATGAVTVVESVASGKNAAALLAARLSGAAVDGIPDPATRRPIKSERAAGRYNWRPVPLETDFFGRTIRSPFLLSAAPPTDGYEQMKKAYDAGWAGGIMKTAFDGVPIHIPAEYMHVFDPETFGNCDNVSGHSLDRVCREIERLNLEYPDRLTGASTGGPLTGNDDADRAGWQKNMRKLEQAGARVVEFSLSCPQGGDGTEGDIVSQNARLTAKIIDWLLAAGDPAIPKLFKLTAAVTSIQSILIAVKAVLDRHPGAKAGVTLANTFPTLHFKPGEKTGWDEGILVGMSGAGVAPISYLTLATASAVGIPISGNGGAMDHRSAADFLALGCGTVQFCTIAMKHGVGIVEHLHSGLSHLMHARGMTSTAQLIRAALPRPIRDFMALTPIKGISSVDPDLCQHCGNCTRCGYLAIRLDENRVPAVDPERCIGCSLCAQKCFAGALSMRVRTPQELAMLKEA